MRNNRVWITLGCCLFALATFAEAQSRKPGLWTITTTVTNAPSSAGASGRPALTGPFTTTVCLSQALIDKYGAPLPQIGSCQVIRLDKKANSVTADLTCSGVTTGKATMESSWTADHATGKIHFIATAPKAAEWTSTSTSVFKSADCGAVPPFPMPGK
jgi:hypothetical protein